MKLIKMFGLAALAALLALTFVGASSAMGSPTTLCSNDAVSICNEVTHVHTTTLAGAKAKLLTSVINVECDVLFLGDTVAETSEPLLIKGNFTYANCGSCHVEEVSEKAFIEILKTAHETASAAGEGEVHVKCAGLNCNYNGEELLGTGKGPLLSEETNGEVSIQEQSIKQVKGLFCPKTSTLDIVVTPLEATYIKTMRCEFKPGGLFRFQITAGECGEDDTSTGEFELFWL